MGNLILLNSVGSLIDDETLMVYPQPTNGAPIDFANKTHYDNCDTEWYLRLRLEDRTLIKNLLQCHGREV